MSDQTIVTLVAAIPTTIAAVGAMLVSLRNSVKADTIIGKADEIHTLTNSTLAKVQAALDVANERIVGLEKLIAATSTPAKPDPTNQTDAQIDRALGKDWPKKGVGNRAPPPATKPG